MKEMEWNNYLEICLIPNEPYVTWPMRYYLYRYTPFIEPNQARIDEADYVVTYESGVWDLSNFAAEIGGRWQKYLEEHIDEYELLGTSELPDGDKLLVYRKRATSRSYQSFVKLLESGLGKWWQPESDTVAITSIHSDKLSYRAGETMTVTIGLKNAGNIPNDGKVWWVLLRPGYKLGQPGSTIVSSKDAVFTLNAGEENFISLPATVLPEPGSYELAVAVQVYTTEQHDETAHGDVAHQLSKIDIK